MYLRQLWGALSAQATRKYPSIKMTSMIDGRRLQLQSRDGGLPHIIAADNGPVFDAMPGQAGQEGLQLVVCTDMTFVTALVEFVQFGQHREHGALDQRPQAFPDIQIQKASVDGRVRRFHFCRVCQVPRPPVRAQAAQIIAIIFGLSNNHAARAVVTMVVTMGQYYGAPGYSTCVPAPEVAWIIMQAQVHALAHSIAVVKPPGHNFNCGNTSGISNFFPA